MVFELVLYASYLCIFCCVFFIRVIAWGFYIDHAISIFETRGFANFVFFALSDITAFQHVVSTASILLVVLHEICISPSLTQGLYSADRRFTTRSREVSKLHDSGSDFSNRSEITHAQQRWWHRFKSTLVRAMACCLTAPSLYLNQCWPLNSAIISHSIELYWIAFV